MINGLARFLGSDEKLAAHDGQLKRQNPSPISEKVENFEEVTNALAALDQFNLSRTPNFEPRRGAAVPTYIATRDAGLIFMPVQGGPTQAISDWLGVLEPSPLIQGMNQRALRDWKASHQPHRSFTVVRHPVARAFETFVTKILDTGPGSFLKIRRTLRNR
ncbi:MAG: nodulation protein NodH, partial [Roseibium sp.]|uniref:hypothetical protein n=1 Tax=Roseibium sp. TaxID=1936156 RepID=UPI001B2C9E1D